MSLSKSISLALSVCGILATGPWLLPRPGFSEGEGAEPTRSTGSTVRLSRDRFSGVRLKVGTPSGLFRAQKVGDRWLFVTPEGNAFWMLGVFGVDTTDSVDDLGDSYSKRILRKYPDKYAWGRQTVKRLKAWGFTTLAEYATWYVLPTKSPYGEWSNPEKMPFVMLIRPSYYGLTNQGNYARGPIKDLVAGTDPTIYTDWRSATTPDVFDPNFDAYVDGCVKLFEREVLNSPWLIGIATDDTDDLFGFGPGPEVKAARVHPHIGWLVLVGTFEQRVNSKLGITYADSKVYSKYALRDFLRAKYRDLKALNAAWRSTYTSWDSDGGWPSGKGLLDESGRSPWVGNDWGNLSRASPAVRADLDDFLYEYAMKYFSVCAARIRQHAGEHLVFGPATLNGWGGLTRKEILRAAGKYLDVLQASISSQQVLDLVAQYGGDIPIVTWEGIVANPDSSLWRYTNPPDGVATLKSQQDRGQAYAVRGLFLSRAKTRAGVCPVVGLKFWAFADSWGEKANWGLVSFLDNAYDGKEAVVARGRDDWGFPTGGEERNYGDFISAVRRTNLAILQSLRPDEAQSGGLRGGEPQGLTRGGEDARW